MSMTSQQCYNRFQAIYGDTSGRFFTATTPTSTNVIWAVEAINEAVDELRSEITHLQPAMLGQLVTTTTYKSNTPEYNLNIPNGLEEISLVQVTDLGGPPYRQLLKVDMQDQNMLAPLGPSAAWLAGGGLGEPSRYYLRFQSQVTTTAGGNPQLVIGFLPWPNRTASSPNVQIYANPGPDPIVGIDSTTQNTPDLPDDFHPLIPLLMAIAAARIDKPFMVQSLESIYNARLVRRLLSIANSRDSETDQIAIDDG